MECGLEVAFAMAIALLYGLVEILKTTYLYFMLDREFQYFLDNQEQWSKDQFDSYVVMVGHTVFGLF